MVMPNFLIVGFQKAGTTSVYRYLEQHPEVFVSPIKELNFFSSIVEHPVIDPQLTGGMTDPDTYRAAFAPGAGHKAIGEASTLYATDPAVPAEIVRLAPETRVIALVRDPAERAYSQYWMRVRDGREKRPFEVAIDDELRAVGDCPWLPRIGHYLASGFYAHHLTPYWDHFAPDRLACYLFEDLEADPAAVMHDIFRFLGVDEHFVADTSVRHNAAGAPKSALMQPLMRKTKLSQTVRRMLPKPVGDLALAKVEAWRSRNVSKPALAPTVRRRLVNIFRSDVELLQGRLGRDLPHWLA